MPSKLKGFFIFLGSLILILAVVAAVYFFWQYKQTQDLLNNPTVSAQLEAQTLVSKVGMLIDLPKNETPTIATVNDPSKLTNQPFFNGSKKGFKVLIYTKAGMAILYDPFRNKIVRVAPVNVGNNNTVQNTQPSITAAPSLSPTPIVRYISPSPTSAYVTPSVTP